MIPLPTLAVPSAAMLRAIQAVPPETADDAFALIVDLPAAETTSTQASAPRMDDGARDDPADDSAEADPLAADPAVPHGVRPGPEDGLTLPGSAPSVPEVALSAASKARPDADRTAPNLPPDVASLIFGARVTPLPPLAAAAFRPGYASPEQESAARPTDPAQETVAPPRQVAPLPVAMPPLPDRGAGTPDGLAEMRSLPDSRASLLSGASVHVVPAPVGPSAAVSPSVAVAPLPEAAARAEVGVTQPAANPPVPAPPAQAPAPARGDAPTEPADGAKVPPRMVAQPVPHVGPDRTAAFASAASPAVPPAPTPHPAAAAPAPEVGAETPRMSPQTASQVLPHQPPASPGPPERVTPAAEAFPRSRETAPAEGVGLPVPGTARPDGVEATTPARMSESPPPAIARIALAVETMPYGGTEIRLDPADLGRVRLQLQTTDTAVTLVITVERPETLDLIRRNLDHLAQDLRALGFADIGLSLSGEGAQDRRGGDQPLPPGQPVRAPVAERAAETTPAPIPAAALARGGLDLRL